MIETYVSFGKYDGFDMTKDIPIPYPSRDGKEPIVVNVYADESLKDDWLYICIIVDRLNLKIQRKDKDKITYTPYEGPLLKDVINIRRKTGIDRVLHWADLSSGDQTNLTLELFNYILDPEKSGNKFFAYILGIDLSKIYEQKKRDKDRLYIDFFETAILYALKVFFNGRHVIIYKVYHEQRPNSNKVFYTIKWDYKLGNLMNKSNNVLLAEPFDTVKFLSKNHREEEHANIIQLCDVFLGACTSIIHGINENSKASQYRKKLMDTIYPLLNEMVANPRGYSKYNHANRIMIRFFPNEENNNSGKFYSFRPFKYKHNQQKKPINKVKEIITTHKNHIGYIKRMCCIEKAKIANIEVVKGDIKKIYINAYLKSNFCFNKVHKLDSYLRKILGVYVKTIPILVKNY
ncbi:hypothetical protein [Thermodesulfovibrio sp.]|uniref:hypothetical protein n=1 Tax=Thermodesulfovibrio sp. TaxID=2067987 RepID=UPI00309981A1